MELLIYFEVTRILQLETELCLLQTYCKIISVKEVYNVNHNFVCVKVSLVRLKPMKW